jgi:hypothetical protein
MSKGKLKLWRLSEIEDFMERWSASLFGLYRREGEDFGQNI